MPGQNKLMPGQMPGSGYASVPTYSEQSVHGITCFGSSPSVIATSPSDHNKCHLEQLKLQLVN